MSANGPVSKFLRFIGIVLMGLTAGFTLLGGAGTSCAAFAPAAYDSMIALAPFQWLYILFVVVGIVLGVLGIRATILLIKRTEHAYRDALAVLIAGVVVGAIHIFASQALRGKSMPVDAVVYTTVLTLVIFLIFRIPAIWQGVEFAKGSANSNKSAGGVTAILLGTLTLSIQYLMGSTHTWNGVNYADAFHAVMTGIGVACLLFGTGLMIQLRISNMRLVRPIRLEKTSPAG